MHKKLDHVVIKSLIALFIVFTVAIFGVFSVFYYYMNQHVENEQIMMLDDYSTQQTLYIKTVLDGQFRDMEAMAKHFATLEYGDLEEVNAVMETMLSAMSFDHFTVSDLKGKGITSDGTYGNDEQHGCFQQTMDGERTICEPFVAETQENTYITLAVPILGDSGEVQGVFSGTYTGEVFADFFLENSVWEFEHFILLDRVGNVIFASEEGEVHLNQGSIFDAEHEISYLDGETQTDVKAALANGESKVHLAQQGEADIYITQSPFGYNGWSLMTITNKMGISDMYAFVYHGIQVLSLVMVIGFLICAGYLGRIIFYYRNAMLEENQNITVEKEMLRYKAQMDAMSGIYNRGTTRMFIEECLEDTTQGHVLLVLDIDGLKPINDTLGHIQGDRAICLLADALKAHFRSTDILGRIGGDEFMVLLRGVENEVHLRSILTGLLQRISKLYIDEAKEFPLRSSIGAVLTKDMGDFQTVYGMADTALYHVKRKSKNNFAIYTEAMEDEDYEYPVASDITLRYADAMGSWEAKGLAQVVSQTFSFVIFGNLTQNCYYKVKYINFVTKVCREEGDFDEMTQRACEAFHKADQTAFMNCFHRERLLVAQREGQERIIHRGRRMGADGNYHLMETVATFVIDEETRDICVIAVSRLVEGNGGQ